MRPFSTRLLLLAVLACCLLLAASSVDAQLCASLSESCGQCTARTDCGWCAGGEDVNGRHVSTCMAGDRNGPSGGVCNAASGATWRYGKQVSRPITVVVTAAQPQSSLPLAANPFVAAEAEEVTSDSAPQCGSQVCDWACNLQCGGSKKCDWNTDAGQNIFECRCKTSAFRWLGMALATVIGVSIAIFCAVCCLVVGCIWWCCKRRKRQHYPDASHEHYHHAQGGYNPQPAHGYAVTTNQYSERLI